MLKILKDRDVKTPVRGTKGSAGIDFFVPNDFASFVLLPGKGVNIPSGIRADIPEGYALVAFNKSGVALKKNLIVGACVIDSDYTGEIHLHVFNVGLEDVEIYAGDKLVQFLLIPVFHCDIEVVKKIDKETERGDGGFGSTNKI